MVFRFSSCVALAALVAVTPAFALHIGRHHKSSHATVRKAHWTPGQREIDPERTRSIQQALIERKYMTGQPSGDWDADTEAAMQKFQADNGWQTKLMPDSRALIKLGLGPNGTDGAAAFSQNNNTASNTAVAPATGADTLASAHTIMN